jgi:4,5-dihydroxyphthalate decarboxylase
LPEPVHLSAVLGSYPHTAALKSGVLTSPDVALDFTEIEPIHKVFAPMVRRQAHDLTELAIVTAIQALAYGKPIVLLPLVVASRLQRGCIITRRSDGPIDPRSLIGRKVGVRAYTQTTGMWVRAALREDFDLPVEEIRWVTSDPAHVEEYQDPAFVSHYGGGKSLPDQLRGGDIDAAILGNDLPKGDEFAKLIPDHRARDEAWVASHGFMPINHMVAVRRETLDAHPQAVRAAYELMAKAMRDTVRSAGELDPTLQGVDALREPLAFIIEECRRQALISGPLDVDVILEPAASLLDHQPAA